MHRCPACGTPTRARLCAECRSEPLVVEGHQTEVAIRRASDALLAALVATYGNPQNQQAGA